MSFWRHKNLKTFPKNIDKVSSSQDYSVFQDIPTFSVKYRFGGQFICLVSAVLDGITHLLGHYFSIYCSSVQLHLQRRSHLKSIHHTKNINNKFQDLFLSWSFHKSKRNKKRNDILLVHIYTLRFMYTVSYLR